MHVVLSVENDRVVPMPVSVTDANSDAANIETYTFRDDRWLIAGVVVSKMPGLFRLLSLERNFAALHAFVFAGERIRSS